MKYLYTLLLASLLACVGCQMKWQQTDDEAAQHVLEISRYDRLEYRYLTTGDFSALQTMNTEYPMETRTLIENVLQIGEATDPGINHTLLKFYQDTTLQTIIADAEARYASLDTLNEQLNAAFTRLQKALPDLQVPMVYAQLTALDQSIVVGDHSVGISLDKYLGSDYPLYQRYGFNEQQRQQMSSEYILPDLLTYYLISLYPPRQMESQTQRERDLYIAKIQWVANKAMAADFFQSAAVATIDRYMRCHPKTSYQQLLQLADHREIK